MTYPETLNYLYTQLPMFTRVGASAYKADLDNTIELCKRLDNPQNKFKTIHVGGTNGKGSTSHMLAAVLQTAGYKTGLYTSPHLCDFRERIRVNGEMISEQTVIDFVAKYQPDFNDIQPSFFEMTVGLAFDVFAKEKVDIAIIEVGLGGRLDSTNIITPLFSIITNIGWDHMNLLGDTLPLIAGEKAGIIKPNIPVIIGEYQSEVAEVFIAKAKQQNAQLTFASQAFEAEITHGGTSNNYLDLILHKTDFSDISDLNFPTADIDIRLDLSGTYQAKNAKAVLCAIKELRSQGYTIADADIQTALRQVKTLTGLRGRWDILSHSPLVIADTGHNPEGIAEVLKNIAATPYKHLHFVMGMVNDKDISKVLSMLPQDATYYFCKPNIPRGLDAENLQLQAQSFGLNGDVYPDVQSAFQSAKNTAAIDDLVFLGGSTFVVAEGI
ncbi:MAG: folylpolyglutamate synthase/dihydrofolate synthase family protein [Mucilaginibacter sp.]|uniref:bifunctional folylpolyglutamate synthase/dihydrofolate synthase n=1 Tax=Mucilaginibacter sp. TaxID=1882438 RepID=UPI003263B7E7